MSTRIVPIEATITNVYPVLRIISVGFSISGELFNREFKFEGAGPIPDFCIVGAQVQIQVWIRTEYDVMKVTSLQS